MIKKVLFYLLLTHITPLFSQNPNTLDVLQGKWYIHFSNFPMWLKGDKTQPTFNYTIEKRGDVTGLKDEVNYKKKGKSKSIFGFDKPTDATQKTFVWRGRGLLKIAKSKWQFVYIDPTNTWAIIGFDKTVFTPSGFDVISKNKEISPDFGQIVEDKLKELRISAVLKRVLWASRFQAIL